MASKTKPTTYVPTHVSIIIDRSGSMQDCWGEMVNAVNSWLKDARADANLKESDTELMVFDSQSIDTLRTGAPVAIKDLTPGESPPRAGTPLYDAVGRGIASLDARLAASGSHKAILIIVTDGEENSSQAYSFAQLQELLKARQAAGWTVLFLGAGLAAAKQGLALGVYAAKTATIGKSAGNLQAASHSMYQMAAGAAATQDWAEARAHSASASLSAGARSLMGDNTQGASLQAPGSNFDQPVDAAVAAKAKAALLRASVKDVDQQVAKDVWASKGD